MIVEREEEVEAFKPREYWTLEGEVAEGRGFGARLAEYRGDKVEQFSFVNEEQATEVRSTLLTAAGASSLGSGETPPAGAKLRVDAIEKKQRKRNPAAPFTTSTLQQEASRKLGFTARRTMMTAQRLYEGIDTGEGAVGLITYMRTDSVNLAGDAVTELREYIGERYGQENLPDEARTYKTKAKNAQEAHEGIRPTSVQRTPESLKAHLEPDQFKLYSLIWKRTVACQMIHAVFDMVALDLRPVNDADAGRFRATGSTLVKPGFIAVYQEDQDDESRRTTTRRHCRRSRRATCWNWPMCSPTSISPNRRHVTPKPAWSRRWRNTASAARPPTPALSRRCKIASMSRWTANASSRPTSAAWSTAF